MKKICISVVLLLTLTLLFPIIASAQFETEELSEKEKRNFHLEIKQLSSEPLELPLQKFAVSEGGKIALGFNNSSSECVSVYDSEGVFLYGLTFDIDGTFGVGFDEENLSIYLVRSNIAITVDSNGEILNALKIKNTLTNNRYWNNEVNKTKCEINGKKYIMDSRIAFLGVFSFSYSRFRVISGDTELVVYDSTSNQWIRAVIVCTIIFLAITVAIILIVRVLKKSLSESKASQ